MDEQNEFMVIPKDGAPDETRVKTLEQFAKDVLADEAYRESLLQRSRTGKLTPAESRMLLEAGRRQQQEDANKPKSPVQKMVDVATKFELDVWLNVARRALGQDEKLIRVANRYIPIAEIVATLEEVYR